MKLNYKRTILVGFAFFLICAFWQAYDNTVPLILTNKFGMSQTWSGVIMALDNVLALFLLPLFALLLKWAYHKRRMNFMQHFVHAIHINSFFLLLVAVPAAILIYYAEAQENNDAILISFELFFALVFLYMLLSSHTVYREGWFKTLVKSLLVFGSFTFVALCIAFVLIIRLIYTYWE